MVADRLRLVLGEALLRGGFVLGFSGTVREVWAGVAPILTSEEPHSGQVPRVAG